MKHHSLRTHGSIKKLHRYVRAQFGGNTQFFLCKCALFFSIKYITYFSNSMFMDSDSPLRRFERSMTIDYEKWHDGIGYDLDALNEASVEERGKIEMILLNRKPLDWRDVEALSILNTPRTRRVLIEAVSDPDLEIQLAVTRYAPDLLSPDEHVRVLVNALRVAEFYGGFSQVLDQVSMFHPPAVISELFKGLLARKGDVAVHIAAMLTYLYGKSDEPFDIKQRPFFLRFNSPVSSERCEAFRDLYEKIGVNPDEYL